MLRYLFSSIAGARAVMEARSIVCPQDLHSDEHDLSLDGVFLDDVDPEWIFWQRESELKHRLYGDYFGLTKQLLRKMEIPLGNSFMPNNDSLNVLVY